MFVFVALQGLCIFSLRISFYLLLRLPLYYVKITVFFNSLHDYNILIAVLCVERYDVCRIKHNISIDKIYDESKYPLPSYYFKIEDFLIKLNKSLAYHAK